MLDIETFDNVRGGNTVYKALAHPVAARALAALAGRIGSVAVVDPEGFAGPLLALCPDFDVEGVYVQDVLAIGQVRGGHIARALTALPEARVRTVLIAAFDAGRVAERLQRFLPAGAEVLTLDEVKLPAAWRSVPERYLDARNFATNFVFFRDDGHFATRLTTANYWAGYGAGKVRFFHILFDEAGQVLAEWDDEAPPGRGDMSWAARQCAGASAWGFSPGGSSSMPPASPGMTW